MCELLQWIEIFKLIIFKESALLFFPKDLVLTWVQQTCLKSRFERGKELLSLIGPLQTKLQVFNSRGGFWEIYIGKICIVSNSRTCKVFRLIKFIIKLHDNVNKHVFIFFTSNDAEKLLNPHVDIDTAKELLHMTAPALKDGTTNII